MINTNKLMASVLLVTTIFTSALNADMSNENAKPMKTTFIDRAIGFNVSNFGDDSGYGVTFGYDKTFLVTDGFSLGFGSEVEYNTYTINEIETLGYFVNGTLVGRYDAKETIGMPLVFKVKIGYEYGLLEEYVDGVTYGISAKYQINPRIGIEGAVKNSSLSGYTYSYTNNTGYTTTKDEAVNRTSLTTNLIFSF